MARALDRTAWQIGFGAMALACVTSRGLASGDAAIHLDVAVSIVERGDAALTLDPADLWVPTDARAGGLIVQDGDTLRSTAAPGLAWVAVPLVALASQMGDAPPLAHVVRPLFEGGDIRALQHDPRVIAFSLIGPACAALTIVLTWLAALALGLSRRARWLAVLALGLGSPLLAYAGTSWTQLPVTALFTAALLPLCRQSPPLARGRGSGGGRPQGAFNRRSPTLLVAVPLAAATLFRQDAAVLAIPFLAAVLLRSDRRSENRLRDTVVLTLPLAAALVVVRLSGTPFASDGWSLGRVPEGALGLTLSPRTGLLVYAPFVLAAPLGFRRLGATSIVAVGAPLFALGLYAGWFDWPASLAYGPRFLLPVLPPLALAFAAAADRLRWRAWLLVAAGLAVQLPGALVTHARIVDLERFFHPSYVWAWRALLAEGPDVAALHVVAYPVVVLALALAGLAVASRSAGSR